jgi:methyltransferase (TIGR00027 family)
MTMDANDAANPDAPGIPADDGWGVTTNLGATALAVAAQRAAETAQANPLIRDEFAALLVAAVNEPGWQTMAGGDLSWMGPEDDLGRRAAVTGRDYVATRTVFFDDFCAVAKASGIRQFVILAAGLDARAYRLRCLADVRVYEIDQPEVLAFKDSVLTKYGVTPVAELYSVPIDLRDDHWPSALVGSGMETSAPTAWLAEGLLPYLSSADHDRLFNTVTILSAPGSWLAAEVYPDAATHFGETRMDTWREGAADMNDALGVGLNVTDYIKHNDPTDTAAWLANRGWAVEALDSPVEMARLGRPIPTDLIAIAPVSSFVTARLKTPARSEAD